MTAIDRIIDRIRQHEGYEAAPYVDVLRLRALPQSEQDYLRKAWSGLKVTFGYGFTFLTRPEADAVLRIRLEALEKEILNMKSFEMLYDVPQEVTGVVIEMCYQIGVNGVTAFRKMLAALQMEDYDKAANEMLDSKWAKQTPNRAYELSEIIRKYTRR